MIIYNKSWNNFGGGLIVAGLVFVVVFVLAFRELYKGGDYRALIICGTLGVLCILIGIAVIRWARKKEKEL